MEQKYLRECNGTVGVEGVPVDEWRRVRVTLEDQRGGHIGMSGDPWRINRGTEGSQGMSERSLEDQWGSQESQGKSEGSLEDQWGSEGSREMSGDHWKISRGQRGHRGHRR